MGDCADVTCLLSILQSIALTADLHDVRVMQQPIQERRGERRIIGERCGPLCEGQVARDDGAGSFIALGDHVEEQVRFLATEGEVSELVDYQKPRPQDRHVHVLGQSRLCLGQGELQHQIGRGDKACLDAGPSTSRHIRRLPRQ